MMMPHEDSSKITIDDFGSTRLLHDIEEISKALYLHDTPPKPSIDQTPQKYVNNDLLPNHKKSSIWKWKPLKALTHIRNHRIPCSFFLHIHSIEGLPLNFNDLTLCVYWKRKHEVLKTRSIRVTEGVAIFDETLTNRCSIYIGKNDSDNVAKYEPKLSLLYVSILGVPRLDIGKHWIDLTRLLPLTLMELEDEKNRNGKWVTSFKLTGKAKGAIINVSFGFSLSGNHGKIPDKENGNLGRIPDKGNGISLQRVRSIPSNSRRRTHLSNLSFDMNGPSISLLYQLLDDPKSSYSNEVYDEEFTCIDKGVEFAKKDSEVNEKNDEIVGNSCIETIDVAELFAGDEDTDNLEPETVLDDNLEELELFLENLSNESPALDFSFHKNPFLEDDYKMVRSRSLDDLTIVDDFMKLVGSDSEPESPRENLLRQFEKETVAKGNFDFDLDLEEDQKDNSNVFDSSFLFREADEGVGQSLITRRKAKMLENLETEALMEEWGLNERAFQNSPRTNSGAFGSPVYCSPERPPDLPPLGDGLGSFLETGNCGFLRSMNPLIFKRAKNGERLIVQVSSSVVLPPDMGSNGVDIMRKWAKIGAEKMVLQATGLMPLEDITGKTLQQLEMEVLERLKAMYFNDETDSLVLCLASIGLGPRPRLMSIGQNCNFLSHPKRSLTLLSESEPKETPTTICHVTDSEYVSMDNIAPSAIEKIQHLLIEGLRIQSRMSTEEPPSSILVSASTSNTNIEELVNMSISLDKLKNPSDKNHGYFGNFTLALQLLLRDPFRDYEPVGIPMLALIQLERAHIEPVVKITEVFLTGFRADLQKKQQSGSRWLNSSGMTGKSKRYSFSKSNALVKSSIRSMNMVKNEEIFWSISKEFSGMTLYVRNPDIVFKSR